MQNDFISREAFAGCLRDKIADSMVDGANREAIALINALVKLRAVPAADVVEVVRCKDCEQYVAGELGYGKCNFFKTAIFSEFYCRYGGKKGRPE